MTPTPEAMERAEAAVEGGIIIVGSARGMVRTGLVHAFATALDAHAEALRERLDCRERELAEIMGRPYLDSSKIDWTRPLEPIETETVGAYLTTLRARIAELEEERDDIDSYVPQLYEVDEDGEPNEDAPLPLMERAEAFAARLSAAEGLEEAAGAVLDLPYSKGELEYLDRGIGTATNSAAYLRLRAALQAMKGAR